MDERLTGGLVHEYLVCPRAAWYSYRHIRFENELLLLGKMLHEKSYKREVKNIFGESISLDFARREDGTLYIYEVKKSRAMLYAAKMQLIFYLKWLKERCVEAHGRIAVPTEKYVEEARLTEKYEEEIERIGREVIEVVEKSKPPKAKWRKICKKCSYHDFCWV